MGFLIKFITITIISFGAAANSFAVCSDAIHYLEEIKSGHQTYDYGLAQPLIEACWIQAHDKNLSANERSEYFFAHASLNGKRVGQLSLFKKFPYSEKSYTSLKKSLELNPYNVNAAEGFAKAIFKIKEKNPPKFILKKIGAEFLDEDAVDSINYINGILSQNKSLNYSQRNQLTIYKTEITSFLQD